ncbi:MAG TPA: hypothetical protein VNK49_03730 [Anaerolineales bacterium]|nr:hypothetical protein [Anaerolineales bacterium]
MKTTASFFFTVVCVGALIACSPAPMVMPEATTGAASATFTPWVAGTETAVAVDTQTAMASRFTATPVFTSPSPTFTPWDAEKPTDFSPVLYGGKLYDGVFFLLLGGVSREGWYAPDMSVARFSGEAAYGLHNMEYVDKYFLWGKSPEFSPACKTYFVGTDADLQETGFVVTLDGWDVIKREVTELAADGKFYQGAVTDWLKAEGVSSPRIEIMQIFRVDIEGDGADEVFISATRLDESQHTTKAGDYSVVLMRKISGSDVVTKLIIGDIYRSEELELTFPRTYSLANFIDLNQDGVLELIVEIQGWEKFGAAVFQIDGLEVIQTLRAEC